MDPGQQGFGQLQDREGHRCRQRHPFSVRLQVKLAVVQATTHVRNQGSKGHRLPVVVTQEAVDGGQVGLEAGGSHRAPDAKPGDVAGNGHRGSIQRGQLILLAELQEAPQVAAVVVVGNGLQGGLEEGQGGSTEGVGAEDRGHGRVQRRCPGGGGLRGEAQLVAPLGRAPAERGHRPRGQQHGHRPEVLSTV